MLHVKSQLAPLHVAVPFAGGLHGVHELPQELIEVFDAHAAPHAWKPALHEMPQLVPLQVELPLLGTEHAVHALVPHELTELFDTHALPHR
ncbi:MAG: hypothetical protein DI536_16810 [Archangium gephyra]|uniref:Uncharacterized protein n=1 Tax=Archangium gephyra TaxID=48 RepID=A0A2W5TL24_9BACT|nr:MAG: hypothetical protein DI536_16810 [Archangium gephyra]